MKRRDFIRKSTISAAAIGATGCSSMGAKKIELKRQDVALDLEITKAKPKGGSIAMKELGNTGIKVSQFGFGSHIPQELKKYDRERGVSLREAFDLGVTTFDVYENNMGHAAQWEPTGRHLKEVINEVVISLLMMPSNGVDLMPEKVESHLERALKSFNRDYIDMVRPPVHTTKPLTHDYMSELFRMKEKGKIRAVGFPIHNAFDIDPIIEAYPIDYMLFPYNFYHNCMTNGRTTGTAGAYDSIADKLHKKGIGVTIMKPLGTDYFVQPLINAANSLEEGRDISLPRAALRYVINSKVNADVIFAGMYSTNHVYENADAFINPSISGDERKLLNKLSKVAHVSANSWYPEYYQFLDQWASVSPDTIHMNPMSHTGA